MSKIEGALIDLSGTLHIEDECIPGSQDALTRLKDSGVKVKLVTNTTKESKKRLYDRLKCLKFDIEKEDIFTSLSAARKLVERKAIRPLLFLEDDAIEDFEGINTKDPNAVVVGLAPSKFQYTDLNNAFRLLHSGAPLIAINKARYYRTKTGLNLGAGPFVAALEFAADVDKVEIVGKPEKSFFMEAVHSIGCDPQNIVMIGDDVRDDIAGAMDAGMMGILVETGKYCLRDENKIDKPPTWICKDFPTAVNIILEQNYLQKTDL